MPLPPNFDWFDLIEYYAFRFVLLISFLYTLYRFIEFEMAHVHDFVRSFRQTRKRGKPSK
jgi:hypothetical protein